MKTGWTRIKNEALASLNFLALAALVGTEFENAEQTCVEAYFEGESQEEAINWIIILDGAQKQDPRAKYVLFFNSERQFLATKNALHTTVVSIKRGDGMIHDEKMDEPIKEKAEPKTEPEISGENYRDILASVRQNYPDLAHNEAQKMASRINTERKEKAA